MEELIFPNQIRTFRRLRGVSMQALADDLGIDITTLSKIERGYRRVKKEQLEKIAEILCCPIDQIFINEESALPSVIEPWQREQEKRLKINYQSGIKVLGAGLRYVRTQKTLTLEQVARNAGITLSVLHRIETGRREILVEELERIAAIYGFTAQELRRHIYTLNKNGLLDEQTAMTSKPLFSLPKGGVPDGSGNHSLLLSHKLDVRFPIRGSVDYLGLVRLENGLSPQFFHYPSGPGLSKRTYCVKIALDPPLGALPAKALLVVDPGKDVVQNDMALYARDPNNASVLRFFGVEDDDINGVNMVTGESVTIKNGLLSDLHKVVLFYCED